jgi:hypothetical protein
MRLRSIPAAAAIAALGLAAACSPAPTEPKTTAPEKPRHACAECHAEQARFHAYGAHAEITCAQCHGCEGDHTKTETPVEMPDAAACLVCHPLDSEEKGTDGVLERHLRWVERKHVVKVDRAKAGGGCVACHDPHLGE